MKGFGFTTVISADNEDDLREGISKLKTSGKVALIVNTNEYSREDLGRPTTTPKENKEAFQEQLRS